jgi:NTP pyrophosphatase (non-canonical NTP hydrolase)
MRILIKLGEESGEVGQVVAKMQMMTAHGLPCDADHWDGTNLRERLSEEIADVLAAALYTVVRYSLDWRKIAARVLDKARLYRSWNF